MGRVDVDSLFTNTPLEETINIYTNLLYNNENVIKGINKSEFKNFLSLATQESYFIFNDNLYKQKVGWPWCGQRIASWTYHGKCFLVIL